jgi:hypothetical protein
LVMPDTEKGRVRRRAPTDNRLNPGAQIELKTGPLRSNPGNTGMRGVIYHPIPALTKPKTGVGAVHAPPVGTEALKPTHRAEIDDALTKIQTKLANSGKFP